MFINVVGQRVRAQGQRVRFEFINVEGQRVCLVCNMLRVYKC